MDLLGRSSSRIRREAADWVARLGTHPGEAELARFKSWHDSDPRHAEAYARIAAIWDGAAKLQRPLASDQPPFSRPVRRFAPAMAAVAAMLIVGLVLAPGLLTTNPPLLLISAAGERRLVELAGGTTIHLEPSSRVEVTLGRRDGRLDLKQGSARFDMHAGEHPFVVRVSDHEVTGAGRFEIKSGPGWATVMPLEGEIEVRASSLWTAVLGQDWTVSPGQLLVIERNSVRFEQLPSREDRQGMILLHDQSLKDAVEAINRSSRAKIRLSSPAIGQLKISGAYRGGDVQGFARSASVAFGLKLETMNDGTILLSARS